jgi:hypothetical protein
LELSTSYRAMEGGPPPPPNVNRAAHFFAPGTVLLVIAIVAYYLRMRTRRKTRMIGWDDYLITVAFVSKFLCLKSFLLVS